MIWVLREQEETPLNDQVILGSLSNRITLTIQLPPWFQSNGLWTIPVTPDSTPERKILRGFFEKTRD